MKHSSHRRFLLVQGWVTKNQNFTWGNLLSSYTKLPGIPNRVDSYEKAAKLWANSSLGYSNIGMLMTKNNGPFFTNEFCWNFANVNQSIKLLLQTQGPDLLFQDNKQHIQPIRSIANTKSYKIQQYQCLHSYDWYRVLTLIFDKPTIISFLEGLSQQINLCIRFVTVL